MQGVTRRLVGPWSAVLAAMLATYLLTPAGHPVKDGVYLAVGLMSAGLSAIAARRSTDADERTSWWLLSAGLVLLTGGDTAYVVEPLVTGRPLPFPTVADAFYIAGFLAIGVVVHQRTRGAGESREAVFDATIFASVAGTVLWTTLVAPSWEVAPGFLAGAVSVAYPLIDLFLLWLMARAVMSSARSEAPLVAAVGVTFIADMVYAAQAPAGAYVEGGVLDALWIASYGLFAAAALAGGAPSLRRRQRPSSPITYLRMGLLALSVTALPVLGVLAPAPWQRTLLMVTIPLAMVISARIAHLLWKVGRQQQALRHQAFCDALTRLPNRTQLLENLGAALDDARDGDARVALLFIDLDDFKLVNDSLSHEAGDLLLVEVGRRLEAFVARDGVADEAVSVARLGGDEFAVLLGRVPDPDVAGRIATTLLHAIARPLTIGPRRMTVAASIGVSVSDGQRSPQTVMREADLAMYAAKRAGGGRWTAFEPTMHTQVLEGIRLETEISLGLDRGEFVPWYQPIVDIDSGRIRSVEALARWQHPERGLLPPADFIAAAERNGQIADLGSSILRAAVTQVATWRRARPYELEHLTVNVNVAAAQLAREDFASVVEQALAEARLPATCLMLELTESVLLDLSPSTTRKVQHLHRLGVRFAIDDFGAGYSSLRYLQRLPIDDLKIDRSFISHMDGDRAAQDLARTLVQLAGGLGMDVTAEGVERNEELELLRSWGCAKGQGFLFARPLDVVATGGLLGVDRSATRTAVPAAA